jgi:tetratricopeptide (TPR) repeat protein
MNRLCILVAVVLITGAAAFCEETFNIGGTLTPTLNDIALLPTRLTSFNQHDDAATASYTCCKPWQEKEILKAIKANQDFLNRYPNSDFAPAALMHYAWVNEVRRNFREQVAAYKLVVENYPDNSMADSACQKLAELYCQDKDHKNAIAALNLLVRRWPRSTHAPWALLALFNEYKDVDEPALAIDALRGLVNTYPKAEECPAALNLLGQKYMEAESYDKAMDASRLLMRAYPYAPSADEAQMRIGQALFHKSDLRGSINAFQFLINRMYGSSRTNEAMRMVNTLTKQMNSRAGGAQGDLYDTQALDPGKEAQEAWDYAMHLQNYRRFDEAITAYRKFIAKYPGNSNYVQAFFNIGYCYQQADMLFQEVNKAKGPDDLFRLQDTWKEATGRSAIPTSGELSAVKDATGAFAYVVNHFVGSPLRDEALQQIARCYTPFGEIDNTPKADAAYTYQELLVSFPGSCFEREALCKVMQFYDDTSNWETSRKMYPALSKALPEVFPKGLEQDKTKFYELMKLYAIHTNFCWFETYKHHIKYAMSPLNLVPDSHFYRGAMLMEEGDYATAAKIIEPLCKMATSEFCAPGLYLLAICRERLGDKAGARECRDLLMGKYHDQDGLKDDAQKVLTGSPDIAEFAAQVKGKYGVDAANMDAFVGDGVVVFAPFTVAARMRMYNMPNIWDRSEQVLDDWTGTKGGEKTVVLVDPACRTAAGNPMMVPACGIADPPNWSLGLAELARNAIDSATGGRFASNDAVITGLANFAAASLQYELVTETRDAIGSAEAVKLPQEAVINARLAALKSLEDYVKEGEDSKISAETVTGMLYSLLDQKGFSRDRLIDREPYRKLFAALKGMPESTKGVHAFAVAMNACFGDTCGEQFKQWHLPAVTKSANAG